jgi:hypothetical protein
MILVWLLTQLQIIIVRYHIILFESHIQYNFKGFSPPIKFYAFDNHGGFNSLVGVRGGGVSSPPTDRNAMVPLLVPLSPLKICKRKKEGRGGRRGRGEKKEEEDKAHVCCRDPPLVVIRQNSLNIHLNGNYNKVKHLQRCCLMSNIRHVSSSKS